MDCERFKCIVYVGLAQAVHEDTHTSPQGNKSLIDLALVSDLSCCVIPPLGTSDLFVTTSSDCPSELLCTEDDILELLLSSDTTKANGPDDISAVILKATAPSIAKGVKILFNK